MRLSKIKLSGFKSFVDPTTINFPGNLMGIVGPNGCGKSNIIDAIRWVLGEGSAKTLRGDSMADVIFNGSSARKPVGQAGIELIFDNSDGRITGSYAGYSEVSVRRVVSRDGTSQYFLNNSRCRRKDITHMLLGTGLGSHGYSIIEQGMISRLVEAKPEDLRAFLEEAAGISKYKERRRDTEHRIRHTRDNLDRLTDLRDELEQQLAHLQRQAKAAEKYKVLKSEERRIGAELHVLRLNELQAELGSQEQLLKDKQLELDRAITGQGEVEASIEKLRVTLAECNDAFGVVQGNYYRVGAEIARLEQTIQHRKTTMQRQKDDLAATDLQMAEISGHIDNDRVELEELEQLLGRLSPELTEASTELDAAERELQAVEQEMEHRRERWDDLTASIADAERTVEVENARIEQLTARQGRIEQDQVAQVADRDAISFGELEKEVEALIAAEEDQGAGCAQAIRAADQTSDEIHELRAEESKVSSELDRLREQLQSDRGRLSSLEALQQAALGNLSKRVDAWLRKRKLVDQPRLADQLEVDGAWERAVETVLAGHLHAVGVESIDALDQDFLASLKDGGLAVLEDNAGADTGASTSELEPLASKVKAPVAAKALLAGVFIAPSLGVAFKQRQRLAANESIVTREGIWIGKHSVRVNRGDDPQLGVLSRADEIEQLRSTGAETARLSDSAAQKLAGVRQRLEELEAKWALQQTERNDHQQVYAETKTQLEAKRTRLDEARERAAGLNESIAALRDEHASLSTAVEEGRRKVVTATEDHERLLDERLRLDKDREHHQERVIDARARAEDCRNRAQEIAITVESRRSSKESASAALTRVQSQYEHLVKRRAGLATDVEEIVQPLEGEEQTLQSRLDDRLRVEAELAEARTAVEACDAKVRDAETRRTADQETVNAAREEVGTVRLAVREVQVRADTVTEQLQQTGFELDTLIAELPEEASSEEWSEQLEKTERRIQRLGAINLAAIDEFDEKSERKQYLDKQNEDLTGALETLEAAIRKIDRETKAKFKDTFDQANQGLSRLFPRLFGGGQAYLELDSDDLLNSGVTVMARPPGKRISTIHLLSGGEKALTAVALVFSIFELNPAPFCLLDEVDAPLDDANVGRFSEIVREMSDQVQFILITHNKTTMESMQQLAGVTMHEPGVSRLVAVDIDEAVKLAAM